MSANQQKFSEVLAEVVSEIRGSMSQAELSRRSGVSRNVIANVEAGRQKIALDQFLRLAIATGSDPRSLLSEGLLDAAVSPLPPLGNDHLTENDRAVLYAAFGES